MSSDGLAVDHGMPPPVRALIYLDMASRSIAADVSGQSRVAQSEEIEASRRRAEVELSHDELAKCIDKERAEAVEQTELQMRHEYERTLQAERAPIRAAVSAFEEQRERYFARAEGEIVQLALAIAAKILHREAKVDPMLVATLVRMAIEKMREGSSVTIRVRGSEVSRWKQYFAGDAGSKLEVVGDDQLTDHDCMVETELGVANFGLDTQLKEVEQGFFDLMALRPVKE